MKNQILLIIQLVMLLLVQVISENAQASAFDNSLLFSKDAFFNSLTLQFSPEKDPEERPEDAPANWNFGFGYDYFNSRINTGDRYQLFRTEFNYFTDSLYLWGLGVNFGSASLEKISLLEASFIVGKVHSFAQNKDSDWNPTFSWELHFYAGSLYQLDPTNTTPGATKTSEAYTLETRSVELRLESALLEPWKFRGSYRTYKYANEFVSHITNSGASQSFVEPQGPLMNSFSTLPQYYMTLGAEYFFPSAFSLGLTFAQAQKKVSSETSQDLHLLLNVKASSDLNLGWGLGSTQSGDGSSPYALFNLGYRY